MFEMDIFLVKLFSPLMGKGRSLVFTGGLVVMMGFSYLRGCESNPSEKY